MVERGICPEVYPVGSCGGHRDGCGGCGKEDVPDSRGFSLFFGILLADQQRDEQS
jgi:hypothetical protein